MQGAILYMIPEDGKEEWMGRLCDDSSWTLHQAEGSREDH